MKITLRRNGYREATIRSQWHVDAELAARIIAADLYSGDGDPGKTALEDAIRTGLWNHGHVHYHYAHEKNEDWDDDYAWAKSLIEKHWPQWNFEEIEVEPE